MTSKALVDSVLAMRLKPDQPAEHDEPETSAGDSCESSASMGHAADAQPASADELAGESTGSVVHDPKQFPNHAPRPQVSVDDSRITHEDREERSRLAWSVVDLYLAALDAEAEKDTEQ